MSLPSILIVDDDHNLLELLKMRLESSNYKVTAALNDKDALNALRNQKFDLSIIDLHLANGNGLSLMEEFHSICPAMPIIILTAYGSIETAVDAIKRGAFNYITKPFDPRELLLQIERALENSRLTSEIKRLKDFLGEKFDFANIIAKSEKMKQVLEQVSRVARTESTVYLHGESGTGKELIAKAVHVVSERKDFPFVAINCAAIPENLLESELFGYEKGAFTGAAKSSKGLFAQAHQGTIFLDEIGDTPISIQAKLLRVLQEKNFYPLGSNKPVEVDVRVIVATNKDLEAEVKSGAFREDLFYRIHVIPIYLPPLRDRKEDIFPLIEHFMNRFSKKMGKDVRKITSLAVQKLLQYNWPGNIRELENTIEYAVAMAHHDEITEDLIFPTSDNPVAPLRSFKEAKEVFEKEYLIRLLEFTEGNITRAAALSKRYRADLYSLLKKHDLKPEDFKKDEKVLSHRH